MSTKTPVWGLTHTKAKTQVNSEEFPRLDQANRLLKKISQEAKRQHLALRNEREQAKAAAKAAAKAEAEAKAKAKAEADAKAHNIEAFQNLPLEEKTWIGAAEASLPAPAKGNAKAPAKSDQDFTEVGANGKPIDSKKAHAKARAKAPAKKARAWVPPQKFIASLVGKLFALEDQIIQAIVQGNTKDAQELQQQYNRLYGKMKRAEERLSPEELNAHQEKLNARQKKIVEVLKQKVDILKQRKAKADRDGNTKDAESFQRQINRLYGMMKRAEKRLRQEALNNWNNQQRRTATQHGRTGTLADFIVRK